MRLATRATSETLSRRAEADFLWREVHAMATELRDADVEGHKRVTQAGFFEDERDRAAGEAPPDGRSALSLALCLSSIPSSPRSRSAIDRKCRTRAATAITAKRAGAAALLDELLQRGRHAGGGRGGSCPASGDRADRSIYR